VTRADENRSVVEAFWTDLYRQDLAAAAARFTPDGQYTDVATPEDDVARGPDEIVRRLSLAWGRVSEIRDERLHLEAGDEVVMTEHIEHWSWPSGEHLGLPVATVHAVREGRITRWTDYWDLGLLMGAAPTWWVEHVMQGWK
jgi:ketosteroid isomerase-like protein